LGLDAFDLHRAVPERGGAIVVPDGDVQLDATGPAPREWSPSTNAVPLQRFLPGLTNLSESISRDCERAATGGRIILAAGARSSNAGTLARHQDGDKAWPK